MARVTRRELPQDARMPAGISLGALAIGFLAINRLVVKQARIKRLEIDELVVGRISRLPPASRVAGREL